MKISRAAVSLAIRLLRTEYRIGQEELSILSDVSQSRLSRYENEQSDLKLCDLHDLASAFGMKQEDLFLLFLQTQERLKKK